MQDMNDHEFDALFRKAAENLEVPYNSKGWKRMHARLNKAGGMGYVRRGLWGLGALLLLLGTGWWLNEAGVIGRQEITLIGLDDAHKLTLKEKISPLPEANIFSEGAALEKTNQPLTEESKGEDQEEVNQAENELESKSDKVDEASDTSDSLRINIAAMQGGDEIYFLQSLGISQEVWTLQAQELDQLNRVKIAYPKKLPQEVIMSHEPAAENRWGLSFALSPDLSSVGLKHIQTMSTKAAIQLEFFVLPDISLSSGAIFSNKIYDASPEDYHQTYSKNYVPTHINAQCKVLDVPLNVRWYALNGEKSRFFISSGLSSYLMLTEDYEYVYATNRGSYTKEYGYKNKNSHLFKVANFSVGYEHTLGKHWAVQAEPFVKLPLVGVGEGEIKLSTIGAFISVHYRWGMRR